MTTERGSMPLAPTTLPMILVDTLLPAKHVNDGSAQIADAIDRSNDPAPGFLRAIDQRFEPAGPYEYVVVDEHGVFRAKLRHGKIAGLVRRQVALLAHEAEARLCDPTFEIAPHVLRRLAIDINELKRQLRVGEDAFE